MREEKDTYTLEKQVEEAKEYWNNQSDGYNSWDSLSEEEKLSVIEEIEGKRIK